MALKLEDLDPDGVHVTVSWDAMDVGWSFFLPCLDVKGTVTAKKRGKNQRLEV